MNDKGDSSSNSEIEEVLSDDSSFYGDESAKLEYDEIAAVFDPSTYWTQHGASIQVVAALNRRQWAAGSQIAKNIGHSHQQISLKTNSHRDVCSPSDHLEEVPYNRYEGMLYAKQLAESASDFLSRLPPSSTTISDIGPWLRVENPYRETRVLEEDVAGFKEEATKLLEQYKQEKRRFEEEFPKLKVPAITRKLHPFRIDLERQLKRLAKDRGLTCGKWMLFPSSEQVDQLWDPIVRGTVDGTLGCGAKVATDDGSGDARLICVYTKDFEDMTDVKRVLLKLKELDLLPPEGRSIYYKCDAWTYLDLKSGNEYNIKANLLKEFLRSVLEHALYISLWICC